MGKYIIIGCLLFRSLSTFSQTDWIKKDLGSKVQVKFPNTPTYKLNGKAGTYTAKTKNNLFIVIVQYDVIPNYSDFLKFSDSQKAKMIDIFLDNAVKGMLTYSGNDNVPFNSIQIGNYKGRETSYNAINPATGENTKYFCKLISAFNKVFTFQCMYLGEDIDCENEKNIFLNSITLN
jgi:hypothetical protein